MKNIIKKISTGLAVFSAMALVMFGVATPAFAADCDPSSGLAGGVECGKTDDAPEELFGDGSIVNTIINTMLFIVGILSVIMIIYAGIRYTTAHGDKGQVESAKNTLIYAIVGLVISIVAYALVNWVTGLWS